jgi:hypothetical protein
MNGYDETKYISCKGCGCEIEADQRKYPYCKTINLSAPKKNSNKLLVIVPTALLVIAAVVVFLITSHAGGNDNILNPDKIKIFTVLNDSGTKSIGTRAELTIDKDSAKSLSAQEFNSFIEIEVSGSEYNWFTIDFSDGTGIVFAGCDITLSTYGKIDDEGMLESTIGCIKRVQSRDTVLFDYTPLS